MKQQNELYLLNLAFTTTHKRFCDLWRNLHPDLQETEDDPGIPTLVSNMSTPQDFWWCAVGELYTLYDNKLTPETLGRIASFGLMGHTEECSDYRQVAMRDSAPVMKELGYKDGGYSMLQLLAFIVLSGAMWELAATECYIRTQGNCKLAYKPKPKMIEFVLKKKPRLRFPNSSEVVI